MTPQRIFWIFFKTYWFTNSGPASIGLLYNELVDARVTEREFVEAVGFTSVLPGSEALKLAIFLGFRLGGGPGLLAALLGAMLPPMLATGAALAVLQRHGMADWLEKFTNGLEPAIASLIFLVGWKFLRPDSGLSWRKKDIALAALSLVLLGLQAPAPLVLVLAGVLGVFLYR